MNEKRSGLFSDLLYNLNFLRAVHRLIRHTVGFTVLSFNQRSPPPEFLSARCHLERTHFITSVLESHGISFSALKIVASIVETLETI